MGNRKRHKFSDILGWAAANALAAFIISYCVVSFFAGPAGLLAYRDLSATISAMEKNVLALKGENARLAELKESYANDPDRIAREARDIGYLRPGERILVLPPQLRIGDGGEGYEKAEPLRAGSSTGLPDSLVKMLAALTALAVFCSSLFMGLASFHAPARLRTTEGRS